MENQRVFWLLVVTVLNSAGAEVTPSYFLNGDKLDLRPSLTPPITSILWKHDGDLLAEWIQNNVDLTYYGDYDGRTTLNISTGHLEIRHMDETKDSGSYTLEINNKVHGQSYDAKVITEVPKPSVWIRPLTCDDSQDNCTLRCDGDTAKAEPVTYTWKKDDAQWKGVDTREVEIFKTKTEHVKTFSCSMKNPVSMKESKPKDNPFYAESPPINVGAVVVGVIVSLGVLALGGIGFWKKDYIKSRFFSPESGGTANSPPENEAKTNSPQPGDVPLLENEGKVEPPSTA